MFRSLYPNTEIAFKIEPNSLAIGDSIFTGSDPWLLTLIDSSNFAYQALATNVVQRINLATFQIDRTVPIYSYLGNPITVSSIVPQITQTIALPSRGTGGRTHCPTQIRLRSMMAQFLAQ